MCGPQGGGEERVTRGMRAEDLAREIGRSGDHVREGIAPYNRFVLAEAEKQAVERELREITDAIAALRARIDRQPA